MFKGLNHRKFNLMFQTEEDCLSYLYKIKWKKGFCCKRCGSNQFWKGRTKFHVRCITCDYDESVTANTLFHKIQIPLVKAFSLVFYLTAFKKGVSCRNLAQLLDVGVKTVWLFKRKAQEAMGACISNDRDHSFHQKMTTADGIILSHRGKKLNGMQKVGICLRKFGGADKNSGCHIIPRFDENMFDVCSLWEGKFVKKGKDILIWNFRVWLTGTHHHCSHKYLSGYFDEYCFRLNFRRRENVIWHSLIRGMIAINPRISA